jgi:two-component system, cell cycle sensor histidine kinase and response regulator CckA
MTIPSDSYTPRSLSSRGHILIAEDSPTQAQKLTWLLEQAGYEVRTAQHGRQALEMMQQQLPDLLITDVVMPEMDGYQLCQAVRKAFGMDVPVMLVTDLKAANDVLKGLKVGADNFLTKPYQGSYLLDQVEYLLSNQRLRGRRKMELGIEIEFGGERHYITSDRQQILDLLISTYHEAVHLNQQLVLNAEKLKTKVKLQSTQLRLATTLQACTSIAALFGTACEVLLSLKQIDAVWFSVQDADGNWHIEAGQMPAASNAVYQPPCRCLQQISGSATMAMPYCCELSQSFSVFQPHLCLPVQAAGGRIYALNLMFATDYGDFDDISDSVSILTQQIESNLQRVLLLIELEERVKQRTKELEQSERRFRAIVESELFGVVILSAAGIVLYQNGTAQKLLNYPPEQALSFQTLLTHENTSPPFSLPLDPRLLERPYAYRIHLADGNSLPVLLKFSHLDGDKQQLLAAFIDMTELRQAETRLAQMQRLESIASLTGGLAHDFNNLLSVILGNTDVLLDDSANQNDKDNASMTVKNAALSGAGLTKQLLAFASRQPLAAEQVNVKQVIQGLKQFIDRVIGKNILVKVNCEENIWPIFTDYSQLESALLNLSVNARDAMPNGGTLSIEAVNCRGLDFQETFSDEQIKGDFIRIEVRDSGEGIPENIQAKVFEPFFTTKAEGKGTGLGLAMVYGFVKQCQGYLQVESSPGDTRFALYFPPAMLNTENTLAGPIESLPYGKGQLVLVVEDNPNVRAIMVRHISSLGYRYLEAGDTDSAAQLLEQQGQDIRLVLTDFHLPGAQSGLDLVKQIVRDRPEMPVVLATGSSLDGEHHMLDSLSQLRLLRKPFRRHELADLIAELMKL